MRYTVRYLGIPIGNVDLGANKIISAGSLDVLAGYAAIRSIVQEGSTALLQLGFFGAAARAMASGDTVPVPALHAAAQLVFELVDAEGNDVPATFINLIEPPNEGHVVVLARLTHSHARRGAAIMPSSVRDESGNRLPDSGDS